MNNNQEIEQPKKDGRVLSLVIMVFGAFLGQMCQTLVVPALPAIVKSLGVSASTGQWMVTLYLLVTGIMVPVTGYLIDRFSVKPLFVGAMTIMAAGYAMTGFAQPYWLVLVGRVLQAMGTGILMPVITYAAMLSFPKSRRGEVMGYIGLVIAFAPALGPSVGGFAVTAFGWQWIFRVLTPLAALTAILALFFVKDVGEKSAASLDIPSFIMSLAGFGLLLFGFSLFGSEGPKAVTPWAFTVIGAIIVWIFSKRQLSMEHPFLNLRVFSNKQFTLSIIMVTIVNAAMISGMVMLPIYIQDVRGYTPFQLGMIMLPAALAMAVANPIAGRFFDRFGARWLVIWGLVLLLAGTVPLVVADEQTSLIIITGIYFARLVGITLIMMPISTWGFNALSEKRLGHASAVNNTARQLAGSLGTAIHVSVLTSVVAFIASPAAAQALNQNPEATLTGVHVGFALSTVIVVGALILAIARVKETKNG